MLIAPVVVASAAALEFAESDPATFIDPILSVSDADSTDLVGATVAIDGGAFAADQDVLGFQDQSGIAGSYDPDTGVLTLIGTAAVSEYEAALRSVMYVNTSKNPSIATRTITFTVDDGTAPGSDSRQVEIIATNDDPTISENAGLSLDEGATATITGNELAVSDVDNPAVELTYTLNSVPANGELLLDGIALGIGATFTQNDINNGLLAYHHDGGETTSDGVEFTVDDGAGGSIGATTFGITVAPVNDAPTVTATLGPVNYSENADPIAIDADLALTDPDSASIAGATVSIVGFVPGQDVLDFTLQPGISGAFNPDDGVLTFDGEAALASYQAVLRSVTYHNTSENPSADTRVIAFAVGDGSGIGMGSRALNVLPSNDPPTITPSLSTTGYVEDNPGVAVDPGLTLTDPDGATIVGATASITDNFTADEDELLYVDQGSITGSYDPQTGVLTLSGSASVGEYEEALRSVKYRNSSNAPNTALRSVAFEVIDDAAGVAAGSHFLSVTSVNDAPVVTVAADVLDYAEDAGPIVIDSTLTITDADDSLLLSAFVQITDGFASGQDVLEFTTQGGVTGSYSESTGILSLSGLADHATYEAVLRSVTYLNTSDNPSPATRTIIFSVDDGVDIGAGSRQMAIAVSNDAPAITATSESLFYALQSPALAVDPGLTLVDVDSVALVGATVTISANYHPGEDILEFTNQAGLVGEFDATTGVLTIQGSTFVENYLAALASVRYRNTSSTLSTDTRTITFEVDDGGPLGTNLASASRDVEVSDTNATPVIATTSSELAFNESDPATPVDPDLTLSDSDSVNLAGATVAITSGYIFGQDELQFADQAGITGAFDASVGVLSLSGAASPAAYQAALRSVKYFNLSENPEAGNLTVTFTVHDGSSSASASRVISIAAVNDAPVLTTTNGSLVYAANDPATPVDPDITLSDVDSINLAGATVSITSGFVSGQDVLEFADQAGLTGSYDALTGVLTLSGAATVDAYQTALRSVEYRNTSSAPSTDARTIAYQVDDGGPAGTNLASAVRSVNVTAGTISQGTPEQQFIARLYSQLLGRAANQGESDAWATKLQAGASREEIVASIRGAAEAMRHTVNSFYQQYLNRPGEDQGLDYWVGRMSSGEQMQVILAGFINSQEYFQRNGASVDSFIDAAYRDLTGIVADSQGMASWLSLLTPQGEHLALIFQLQSSADFRRATIEQLYGEFLGRSVDDAALEFWQTQFASASADPHDFLDRFELALLCTDEFFNDFGS